MSATQCHVNLTLYINAHLAYCLHDCENFFEGSLRVLVSSEHQDTGSGRVSGVQEMYNVERASAEAGTRNPGIN